MKNFYTIFFVLFIGFLFTTQNVFGQTPGTFTATWAMTSSSESVPTLTGTQSGTVTASTEAGMAPSGTGGSPTSQKWTGSYPATLTLGSTFQIDFPIKPSSSTYTLNISSISYYFNFNSSSGGDIAFYYTTDGGTTWSSQLQDTHSINGGEILYTISGLNINVLNSNTFNIVIFPWSAHTGSNFYIYNVVINGTTSAVTPVEMTTYSAKVKGQVVTLNWATATEIQNSGWDIERSNGNNQWTKIGFVQGNGNSNSPHQYSYVDNSIKQNGTYTYRLKQIDVNGTMVYSREIETIIDVPLAYSLNQNYPNPFNPSTAIGYQLSAVSQTTLKVYNVLGEEVATLVNEVQQAGEHTVNFNASNLSSGIYFYKLTAGNFVQTKKMILLK